MRWPSAHPRACADEAFEPTAGRAGSLLVNIPALIAVHRSYLAMLRGDAEATAAFASRALAKLGEGERMLEYLARFNLAIAEWLRGHLAEAERVFVSSIAGWANKPTITAWGRHILGQVQRAPGPPGRGRPELPAGTGEHHHARSAAAAPPVRRMWTWARWPISGTSSTPRYGRSPRASRCAGRSPTPRRSPRAWSRWRGSGRLP